jgi:hypothetical protein
MKRIILIEMSIMCFVFRISSFFCYTLFESRKNVRQAPISRHYVSVKTGSALFWRQTNGKIHVCLLLLAVLLPDYCVHGDKLNMKLAKLTSLSMVLATAFVGAAMAQDVVNVGVSISATGPAASLGIPEKNTVDVVPVDVGGVKVNYVVYDDATDTTQAVKNMRKLISENKIDVMIGSTVTPGSLAMVDVAAENKVPVISPAGNAPTDLRLFAPGHTIRQRLTPGLPADPPRVNNPQWLTGKRWHRHQYRQMRPDQRKSAPPRQSTPPDPIPPGWQYR